MEEKNTNYARMTSPHGQSKQGAFLKHSRRKRDSASVIRAEEVNGFRGNDSLEALVDYIEGTTTEHSTKQTSNKDLESKNKKVQQRRKGGGGAGTGTGSKNEKSKKSLRVEETRVITENDGDAFEVNGKNLTSETRRTSVDDSEDGVESQIPAEQVLCSPKSDDYDTPSSCSVEGIVESVHIENFEVRNDCDDKIIDECSRETVIKDIPKTTNNNTCQNTDGESNLPVVNKLSVPYNNSDRTRNIGVNQQHSVYLCDECNNYEPVKFARASSQCSSNQNAQSKVLVANNERCSCCRPSKAHVEFLDKSFQDDIKNAKESSFVLNDLSFGCFDDCFPSSCDQNNVSTTNNIAKNVQQLFNSVAVFKSPCMSKMDVNKNIIPPRHVTNVCVDRTKLSPSEKQNESVSREIKEFVTKRKTNIFTYTLL